jgi:hypothetical protein
MTEELKPDRESTQEEYDDAQQILLADSVAHTLKAIMEQNPSNPKRQGEKRDKEAA